ncbi:hypothetical protein JOL79_09730 [Microbispora sp. RL4-1S]|uniref:Uncharacterized protein n=1 Tax=Microbispora oryzae TaxID=2806554 RepID=A0A940WJM9_9ACTN|nr:permease prefix domain 1-containing protein [Microbispora oryzae]MBP2704088.1 hypothetical protein [Microbispora oryzae]
MADADVIDQYVAALGRGLRGPGAARRDLLTEARDSLLDAAEAYEQEGLSRPEAEHLAVADFGAVDEIRPDYQRELALSQGRRTAALLFLSVPLTALMWAVIWRVFPESAVVTMAKPGWFDLVARGVDGLQAVTGVVAGIALFALGRGLRVLRRPVLVIRALGLFVWLETPFMAAMGVALSKAAHGPVGFADYAPGVTLSMITYALTLWQLWSATRCLRVTAVPALTVPHPSP